jgi:hypothetical protein
LVPQSIDLTLNHPLPHIVDLQVIVAL